MKIFAHGAYFLRGLFHVLRIRVQTPSQDLTRISKFRHGGSQFIRINVSRITDAPTRQSYTHLSIPHSYWNIMPVAHWSLLLRAFTIYHDQLVLPYISKSVMSSIIGFACAASDLLDSRGQNFGILIYTHLFKSSVVKIRRRLRNLHC